MNRAPSIKTITDRMQQYDGHLLLPLPATAKIIRTIMRNMLSPKDVDDCLKLIDSVLQGHGVESLQGDYVDGYFQRTNVLYCNMGDTYASTILYDTKMQRWYCCSWGDFVEYNERRFRE
jgi:hypothetical protein